MKIKLVSIFRTVLLMGIISLNTMETACAQVTSDKMCEYIKELVCDDLMKQGIMSRDSAVLFLPAKSNNHAFQRAQDLCIKLQAKMTEKSGNSTTYTLSDETGKITIVDFGKGENIYATVYLNVNCAGLTSKEIRFISLRAYTDLERSEYKRRQSNNSK